MGAAPVKPETYALFGEILQYPGPGLSDRVAEGVLRLAAESPDAASLLSGFREFLDRTPPGRLEEVYTASFDLSPSCIPYVGHQIFGDGSKRGAFMSRLNEIYACHGFSAGNELPDHLTVVLRFLAGAPGGDDARAIAEDGLLPALDKMVLSFDGHGNPYGDIVRALAAVLSLSGEEPARRESSPTLRNED